MPSRDDHLYGEYKDCLVYTPGREYTRLHLNAFPRAARYRMMDPAYRYHSRLGPYYFPQPGAGLLKGHRVYRTRCDSGACTDIFIK